MTTPSEAARDAAMAISQAVIIAMSGSDFSACLCSDVNAGWRGSCRRECPLCHLTAFAARAVAEEREACARDYERTEWIVDKGWRVFDDRCPHCSIKGHHVQDYGHTHDCPLRRDGEPTRDPE